MSVFQMMYVSGVVGALGHQDVEDILETSRAKNAARGITGVLIYSGDMFLQVLEGDRDAVRALARRIETDPRHRNFMVLAELTAQNRAFQSWAMGFRRIDPGMREHRSIFLATRKALAGRISQPESGVLLETIVAFGGDVLLDA